MASEPHKRRGKRIRHASAHVCVSVTPTLAMPDLPLTMGHTHERLFFCDSLTTIATTTRDRHEIPQRYTFAFRHQYAARRRWGWLDRYLRAVLKSVAAHSSKTKINRSHVSTRLPGR